MNDQPAHCPSCSRAGAPVERITLKALLTAAGLRRGIPAQPRYCATRDCPVVYFDAEGAGVFTESDLTVRVYAKHPDDPEAPVCYCFGIRAGAMAGEEGAALRRSVAEDVKAGRCACEVRNPSGGCCLGDLVRLERSRPQATSCCGG